MTKANVVSIRNKLKAINDDYIKVLIDENYNFTTRDSFLDWDDAAELLTVIMPTKNTQMTATKSHRVEIQVFEYDRIISLSTVPKSLDNSWIAGIIKNTKQVETIKNRIEIITKDEYFTK